ncbi:hypothetical protein [Demequina salsinemoris]|uniref:hypothetical protein n=1 Tax=Demequina salsinemoris TaxID=577470 RepID=UPI000780AFB0|nr:hypothetical protein [Demequina salsinemoris]
MSIEDADVSAHGQPKWPIAVAGGVVSAFTIAVVAAFPLVQASSDPDPQDLSADQIASLGYEETATELLAGVWDSSYGPTVVALGGDVAPAPGSSDGDVTLVADHSGIDVDSRFERTSAAPDRAAAIAEAIPMTATGRAAVASLIADQRAIEHEATAASSGADIVALTVAPTAVTGHLTDTVGHHWVEVTLNVTEEYRDGVVSEGVETAIVVFDHDSHEVIDAVLLTQEDAAP